MSTPILSIKNISKSYEGYPVLNNISLDLFKGEVHFIIGENGAGKSTLMKIISGVLMPDSGEILWQGKPAELNSPYDAHKLGIVTIYQEPNLFSKLSIAENLFLHKWIDRFPIIKWEDIYHESELLLKKFGMNINPRIKIERLSLAEKRLIEIIGAFSRKSKVLIMDEATAALTENELDLIKESLVKLTDLGVAVFYISQRISNLYKIGKRVSILRDGKIIDTNLVEKVTTENVLEMAAGETLGERYPKINVEKGRKVLEVKNLSSCNFLREISFSLRRGEVLGLAGVMGSGRSLLGKVLFGVKNITKGEIKINGQLMTRYSINKAIENGVCYIPEDRFNKGFFPALSIVQNITLTQLDLFSHLGIINSKEEIRVVKNYIEKLVIKNSGIFKKAYTLSGGNQQKTVLARWFNSGANIFILDEPTKGIDIASKTDVYSIINKLLLSGAAILMISSDLNELLGMCDRIFVLKEGRIVAEKEAKNTSVDQLLRIATY
ncbi:sugar ABC transporter ATP-binding protein [Halocella sp. SP3-1]|nr:sugar ABC transporter ATP-binding protein [Halocella sp. SP3-1]